MNQKFFLNVGSCPFATITPIRPEMLHNGCSEPVLQHMWQLPNTTETSRVQSFVSTAFYSDVSPSQATAGLSSNHDSKTVCEVSCADVLAKHITNQDCQLMGKFSIALVLLPKKLYITNMVCATARNGGIIIV
jgi:hypothetical protein